jgi:hypothetical protein
MGHNGALAASLRCFLGEIDHQKNMGKPWTSPTTCRTCFCSPCKLIWNLYDTQTDSCPLTEVGLNSHTGGPCTSSTTSSTYCLLFLFRNWTKAYKCIRMCPMTRIQHSDDEVILCAKAFFRASACFSRYFHPWR